jgi:aminoglycoside 6'-N-acetyltransferase
MVVLRPAVVADIEFWQSSYPHNLDWEAEITRDVDWQWNLIAEVEGRPIGVIMIIDPAREETHYWGSVESNLRALDIWIGPPEELGRGFGTEMMRLALDFCFANPAITGVLIDPLESNTRARAFYERVGFRFVEYRRFGMDDCAVYRLDRQVA